MVWMLACRVLQYDTGREALSMLYVMASFGDEGLFASMSDSVQNRLSQDKAPVTVAIEAEARARCVRKVTPP